MFSASWLWISGRVGDFLSEPGHDSAANSRLRTRERAISRFGASVVREHRPVVRSRFTVQNQDSAFAEIEFGMSGLGFYWGTALPPDGRRRFDLSFAALRLSM